MKKILIALVIVAIIAAGVFFVLRNDDEEFIFTIDTPTAVSQDLQLPLYDNALLTITEGKAVRNHYFDDQAEEFEGDFSINGVAIGSTAKDFITAFDVKKGQAMWETYLIKGPKETIFNYPAYNGSIISRKEFDDLFFTVGFHFDQKTESWKILSTDHLFDIYHCELEGALLKTYENSPICIISAGFDQDGKINQLDIDYAAYYRYNEKYSK